MNRTSHLTVVVHLSLATMLSLGAGAVAAETFGTFELQGCHLEGYRQEVLCGTHSVFEDRLAAAGRKIDIRFAVIPAVDDRAEPDPLVLFAGGPGQSAMTLAPLVRTVFSGVNEHRDIVLIDQRGIGSSHPLDCESPGEADLSLSPEELEQLARELLQACLDALDANVRLYTQDLANEDIHEILEALGYSQINLYGGSWGTRSGLLYAHRFPGQVRTLVLDGAHPLTNPAPLNAGVDAESALDSLFEDCAADVSCAEAFPTLQADYLQALERLRPDGVEVTMEDPATAEIQPFLLTAERFADALRGILYQPVLGRVVPIIIQRASVGDYRALRGVSGTLAGSTADAMTIGASLTIFCSEEFARMGPGDLDPESEHGLLGQTLFGSLRNACDVWPRAPLPAIYEEDVGSTAPALILSGELDPITPPRWGDELAKSLPRSLHLVATATGHGVAPQGCAADLIEQFIAAGSTEDLDGSCLTELTRPSFFVDGSGPRGVTDHD